MVRGRYLGPGRLVHLLGAQLDPAPPAARHPVVWRMVRSAANHPPHGFQRGRSTRFPHRCCTRTSAPAATSTQDRPPSPTVSARPDGYAACRMATVRMTRWSSSRPPRTSSCAASGDEQIVVLAFPYDARSSTSCAGSPGRRFDWDAREWWAPVDDWVGVHVADVLERFPDLLPSRAGRRLADGDRPALGRRRRRGALRRPRLVDAGDARRHAARGAARRLAHADPTARCSRRSRSRAPRRSPTRRPSAWTPARGAASRRC